jgi:hypothetical protein
MLAAPDRSFPRFDQELQSAGDPEISVPLNLFGKDVDPLHAGVVRSYPAPRHQRVHVLVDPLEGRLHVPVREVADEAAEPSPAGKGGAGRAEEDSLDSTGDHYANPLHREILTESGGLEIPKGWVGRTTS